RGVTIMVSEPGYETVGSKDLTCEDWMVNTHTDADLSAAVQNTLQTLLPQIRAEIREEFRTSSGPSDAGGNPPPAKGGDAWLITVTWADFKKLFFLQFFPRAEQERLKREYHSIRQTNTETSTEFMHRFLRLVGFLETVAGTEEEQAKNFQWGLRRSTLNHLMCMSYTNVAQVANDAHNYEILHERNDDDAKRPDKRQKSGDRHQPTSQQSSHRNHGYNNDRHGSDRRGGSDNHRSSNNYFGNNNMNSANGRDQRNRGQQSNRSANSGNSLHPGKCRRAAGTCFKCGQAGHLQKDCKKNITASTSGQADKKPGATGRVFAITEDHATKTS
nr:hypothetical protein [Tanacetum cinerariifolium]